MGKRNLSMFNVGDLVMWYESYADGGITKDAGYGIVLNKNTYEFGFKEGPYINYKICRYKRGDVMTFSEHELKRVEN